MASTELNSTAMSSSLENCFVYRTMRRIYSWLSNLYLLFRISVLPRSPPLFKSAKLRCPVNPKQRIKAQQQLHICRDWLLHSQDLETGAKKWLRTPNNRSQRLCCIEALTIWNPLRRSWKSSEPEPAPMHSQALPRFSVCRSLGECAMGNVNESESDI